MTCTNEPVELRVLRCWEDREILPIGPCPHAEYCEECSRRCWAGVIFNSGATCMLPRGHRGPHDFTNNDEIGVSFADAGVAWS